jgi:hypothetical protein
MNPQNPSTSMGEGRGAAPSLAHPSQKQNLVTYTEELTHLPASAALIDVANSFGVKYPKLL